jgi:hypothetical protein
MAKVPKTATNPAPPPPPLCRNYPQFKSLPSDRWTKEPDGNCYFRGPDSIGLCKGDSFKLTSKDEVADTLAQGYVPAIVVNGVGMVCLVSDVTTFHANPEDYVFSNTYVEAGDTHFPLYACSTPFGNDTVPFYKFYVSKGTSVTPTAKEEPGCTAKSTKKAAVKRHVLRRKLRR